jgi:hypothetical protein
MNTHDDPMNRLKQVDPINAEQLIAAWSDHDAKASLFKEITSMPSNTNVVDIADSTTSHIEPATPNRKTAARSRRRLPLLAIAAAVVAIGVAIGSSLVGHPQRAYAVSQGADGLIHVNILAGFRDGDALAKDLNSRGIRTRISVVPASPSMVGKVELFNLDGPSPGITTDGPDGTFEVFDWTIDPALFKDTVTVQIYVEPKAGEPIRAAQEIFEPGEKLAGLQCALGEPVRAADVARYLDRVGLTAKWNLATTAANRNGYDSVAVDSVPEGVVMSGYAMDRSTARFDVLKDGEPVVEATTPHLSDVACTPEAASPWK